MPELPEVETVVRDLRPLATGRTIVGVRRSKKNLRTPWRPEWDAKATGRRFGDVRRRGKWIVMELAATPQAAIVVHLGMSGQFTSVPTGEPEPTHLHVVFALDDGTELRLRDPRRFGSATFFETIRDDDAALDLTLGPEPFGYPAEAFRAAMASSKRNLKALLLDQTVIAGVGNIYADEALFRAKLHPARTGKSLTPDEADRLREAVELTLARAIEHRGSTIRDYVGGSGLRGGFQNEHAVYGRPAEPCPACGAAIECARLAGRASHYCPVCQPKKPTRLAATRSGARTAPRNETANAAERKRGARTARSAPRRG